MSDEGGTYTLLVELPEAITREVGALGALSFEPGWYAYVGSARGPGGFSRIQRHRELARGERRTRHWHVDYLLTAPAASIDTVVTTAGVDAECDLALSIDGEGIAAFGCSDCDCESHLFYRPAREPLLRSVERAHEMARA